MSLLVSAAVTSIAFLDLASCPVLNGSEGTGLFPGKSSVRCAPERTPAVRLTKFELRAEINPAPGVWPTPSELEFPSELGLTSEQRRQRPTEIRAGAEATVRTQHIKVLNHRGVARIG